MTSATQYGGIIASVILIANAPRRARGHPRAVVTRNESGHTADGTFNDRI